jgi:hypothetical protein
VQRTFSATLARRSDAPFYPRSEKLTKLLRKRKTTRNFACVNAFDGLWDQVVYEAWPSVWGLAVVLIGFSYLNQSTCQGTQAKVRSGRVFRHYVL